MDKYTASNGITVDPRAKEKGGIYIRLTVGGNENVLLTDKEFDALREFFRAEEDERLGRWRWPENPDYVVYPSTRFLYPADEDVVFAMNETNGQGHRARRGDPENLYGRFSVAARAYFDAHLVPKPAWHDAKEGEVWALAIGGEESAYEYLSHPNTFIEVGSGSRGSCHPNFNGITAGRRIWPEPEEQ